MFPDGETLIMLDMPDQAKQTVTKDRDGADELALIHKYLTTNY
jgi:hypothetical protein